MVKRKVSILDQAARSIGEISRFIESNGSPQTASKFVIECFDFFGQLSNKELLHKPCSYKKWEEQDYRCVTFKKKYVVAYSSLENEIIICDFVSSKLLS